MHNLKYNFRFTHGNDDRLVLAAHELSTVVKSLTKFCEERDTSLVQLYPDQDSPKFRELIAALDLTKFALVEFFDDDKNLCGVSLLYKRKGWTAGREWMAE